MDATQTRKTWIASQPLGRTMKGYRKLELGGGDSVKKYTRSGNGGGRRQDLHCRSEEVQSQTTVAGKD